MSPGLLSQEFTYPLLSTIDPLEVKINSILLYKIVTIQRYSPPLSSTIAYFLLVLRKKLFCVSFFSVKEFLIYKFKLLSFLKRLYIKSCYKYLTKFISPYTIYLMHFIAKNDFIRAKH